MHWNEMDFMFESLLFFFFLENSSEKKPIRNVKSLSIAFLTIKINAEFEISMTCRIQWS